MDYRGLFIGLTTIDIQYFVDEFPVSNKKIKTNPPSILVGGPAANAAVAFSYLNKGAHLATAVGANSFSSFVHNDFIAHKIDFTDIIENQTIEAIVASVVTSGNGDRNIFTHNPVENETLVNIELLFEKVNPQVLLLDGFYPAFSLNCAKVAQQKGVPVVMDCGSWKPQYTELLKYTDVAICSADFFPPQCAAIQDVFDCLKALGLRNIAISRGAESILFFNEGRSGEVAVDSVSVVDTLGAGDFLHGAFCYYLLEKNSFVNALKKAAEIASFSCRFKGTREWFKR